MDFTSTLSKIAADIDVVLDQMIPADKWEITPANVSRYAALDAGKRLRSFLTVTVGGLFDVPYDSALRAGACVELIHNWSLIHDDLPCIDNDALRRGRPSAWVYGGEANAVLAGDFLLNQAYNILATDIEISKDPAARLELVKALSDSVRGMILGEWMDIMAESGMFKTAPEIAEIQSLKTGCLFNACTEFGAILGGADALQRAALKKFTDAMGLCFQITDDILDVVGDVEKVGKALRKDAGAGKATFVSLLGLDGARAKAMDLAREATDALSIFDHRADNLRELMRYMISRES